MEHLNLWLTAIVGIFTILGIVTGTFKRAFLRLRQLALAFRPDLAVPRRTVSLVQAPHQNALWWHMGSLGDSPAMQVVGDLKVTNVATVPVVLPAVRMKKPAALGFVSVQGPDLDGHGEYPLEPGICRDLRFHLWVNPPIAKPGHHLVADVAIIDQFNNKHWLKNLRFEYK